MYPPESPSVSFSPSASASASASPLASISSVSPLASRDKPLPEPPTSCSSPDPELGRAPEESRDVVERHVADHEGGHDRDDVHDHDNDNNIGHEHQHEHHHKPSYDYGEYGYQFQPECSNAWDSNEHPDEPPVQPLEDYAIPLAPFRQRENYDYALILAKELCTVTRDTSGLTVTSIHEVGHS